MDLIPIVVSVLVVFAKCHRGVALDVWIILDVQEGALAKAATAKLMYATWVVDVVLSVRPMMIVTHPTLIATDVEEVYVACKGTCLLWVS